MSKKQLPEATIQDGAIKATIWRNEGDNGPYFATTITRTYRDAAGNPKETNSLVGTDLLRAAELARGAYARSRKLMKEARGAQAGDNLDDGPSR
ncbi:hypothetical protein [Parvularcula sp. LCG005]|uniref:hypothetical protein n=1 Tax=Parvularcula sp. LCG005 TaxID=3078805 RepID=UPI002942CAF8|nr:hypothetical protein [Parvularcula sp. LCG005]WOI52571.1 hypothetical protein RUI03_10475 [Parvularcula sp. LCG005]WOI52999.1 hypothetical protein RUI03_12655 [Parvularcula sp. LCG005]